MKPTTKTTTAKNDEATQAGRLGRRSLLAFAFSLACERRVAKAPQPAPPPPRYSGKLEDYVPAAGLRWLVRAQPAKLAESQSFRPAFELLFPKQRLAAVARATGFALESAPRGVIAGYDLGTLYLAELAGPTAKQARDRFESRQIHPPQKRVPDPNIVVLSGLSDGIPAGLVTLDDRVVAYATGDPMLWRVVEAYARGKLHAKSAFEGAALAGQASETDDALLAAHAPGPFGERWQGAAGGLLEITTSVSARLDPTSPEHSVLQLVLHGDFADSNAAERLLSSYRAVAGSSTGNLLGLSRALDAITQLNAANDRLSLVVPLPITELVRGIRAATSANLEEIFRLSPNGQ